MDATSHNAARRMPMRIGVVGPPAAGKSTVARMFADLGVPFFEADAVVDELYAPGGAAVAPVVARWPHVAGNDGGIDRAALRRLVTTSADVLNELEKIVHPLVARAREDFLAQAMREGAPLVVMEIPILDEDGRRVIVDRLVQVEAPSSVRLERLRARPGFSEELLRRLEERLLSVEARHRRADVVLDGTLPREELRARARALRDAWAEEWHRGRRG